MASPKLSVFTLHSRHWRENRYVYPVISRRSKGLSIGVNLNPDRVCNFNCVYCCVDRTTPSAVRDVDFDVLAGELDRMLGWAASGEIYGVEPISAAPQPLRRLNDVAFSGDGEPTSCGRFEDACRLAADLLAKHRLRDAKIVLITNATLLHRPAVARALEYLDAHNGEIWAKLDAGTEEFYRHVERTSIPLRRVLENIASAGQRRPIVIQSLFMRLDGKGPGGGEISAYVDRLGELVAQGCQIKLVQVYTLARKAMTVVDAVAAKVRDAGMNVETFYGPQ